MWEVTFQVVNENHANLFVLLKALVDSYLYFRGEKGYLGHINFSYLSNKSKSHYI